MLNTQLAEVDAIHRAYSRLVLFNCAGALVSHRKVYNTNDTTVATVFEWDATNVGRATRTLGRGDMMVMRSNLSFVDINALGRDDAWHDRPNLKEVVVHNQYDPEQRTTSQLTIPCGNPEGATVHILSGDYFRTFNAASPFAYGQFLTDNAGFPEGQPYLNIPDNVACDYGAIHIVDDANRNGWRRLPLLSVETTRIIRTTASLVSA